mmetsp:Transcript_59880/g.143045  ORF Transcript_59880/g.143045 Transcript_59880/m.143045 type:complete len:201 (+) Transcript_59880:595-1197(+)
MDTMERYVGHCCNVATSRPVAGVHSCLYLTAGDAWPTIWFGVQFDRGLLHRPLFWCAGDRRSKQVLYFQNDAKGACAELAFDDVSDARWWSGPWLEGRIRPNLQAILFDAKAALRKWRAVDVVQPFMDRGIQLYRPLESVGRVWLCQDSAHSILHGMFGILWHYNVICELGNCAAGFARTMGANSTPFGQSAVPVCVTTQ